MALLYSAIGFLIIIPVYFRLRLYRNALFTFLPDKILIERKAVMTEILVEKITRVLCMDSHSLNGESRQKLTIYFQYSKEKGIRVKLKEYL